MEKKKTYEELEKELEEQKKLQRVMGWIRLIGTSILLIIILYAIYSQAPKETLDLETIKCIAEKSELYVSKTCGHCAEQKQILREYMDLFTIKDCSEMPIDCIQKDIYQVPTWIINGEKIKGKKTLEKLKELSGC